MRAREVGEVAALLLVLGFVGTVAYIPHLDTSGDPRFADGSPYIDLATAMADHVEGERPGYRYPLHADEHWHWAHMADLERSKTIAPKVAEERDDFYSLRQGVHEKGFHVVISSIHQLTGIHFARLFQYLPALWTVFTAFSIWALLRPLPSALPAAAFVALVPTTIRFLGPGFLVPIGFGLAWLPAALILLRPAQQGLRPALVLSLIVTWAFFIHLMAGFAAVGLLLGATLLGGVLKRPATLWLALAALVPLAWLYQSFSPELDNEIQRGEFLAPDFTIFDSFGLWGLGLWIIGLGLIVLRPPAKNRMPVYACALGSVAALTAIVAYTAYGVKNYALYDRMHAPFFLLASVPAGHAVAWLATSVYDLARRWTPSTPLLRAAPPAAAAVAGTLLFLGVAQAGVEGHTNEPYYHWIDDRDWVAFTYVEQHVGPEYDAFLTHPYKGPVLAAMSGKRPHAYLIPGTDLVGWTDYEHYATTGGSLEFFVTHDISLVLTTGKPPFDEFVQLGPGVWGLRPDIAREMATID